MALTAIDLKNTLALLHRVRDINFGPECTTAAVLQAKIAAEIQALEAASPPEIEAPGSEGKAAAVEKKRK